MFDGLTGRVLTVKAPLIKETFSQTEQAVMRCLEKTGLHSAPGFERLVWEKSFDAYLEFIDSNIPCLLLQMTTNCNLNCDYCVYSPNYAHMENHGDQNMSLDTTFKSIDFFADHNGGCGEAEISFYGGETLLCFREMREAVQYARKRFAGKKLVFSVTTNGTLLNEEVVAWLAQNVDVQTTITLNGPFHDEHRKTASGKGSLACIMRNLQGIRRDHPQLWNGRIHFIANITKASELETLRSFYQKEVGKAPSIITHVRSQNGNDFIQDMIYEATQDQEKERFSIEYCESGDAFLAAYFGNAMNAMENRLIKENDGVGIIGSCLPFTEKLFVHADGKFGICETACDKAIVGDLQNGFDFKVLAQLYEKAAALFHRCCRECWAKNLCTVCFKDILDIDGTILEEIPKAFCTSSRRYALEQLRMYCTLKSALPKQG
ncbi:MAG: radical SAM protein [Clostridiales bacterium]|nr:radical SAM protein [Clostridiales bacterium]